MVEPLSTNVADMAGYIVVLKIDVVEHLLLGKECWKEIEGNYKYDELIIKFPRSLVFPIQQALLGNS